MYNMHDLYGYLDVRLFTVWEIINADSDYS